MCKILNLQYFLTNPLRRNEEKMFQDGEYANEQSGNISRNGLIIQRYLKVPFP
jgi:hypothetical protein